MARHHLTQFSSIETVKVGAIASRSEQTGNQLSVEYRTTFIPDWRKLLEQDDIEGVVICTHNDSHGEITIAALKADKHVFVEYPLANDVNQGVEILNLAKARNRVLRVSHPEAVSNTHTTLKQKVNELRELLLTSFVRLTPGRGARPEILFNLPVSGTPAHFFIYHIYPVVDFFGEAAWVEGAACYEGLTESGLYDRFVNTVTVAFKGGGIGQWSWAGGIDINTSQQHQRYVLTKGTLINDGNGWHCSTPNRVAELTIQKTPQPTLQELWLSQIQDTHQNALWFADAEVALSAIKISLASAQSIHENRRIQL